MARFVGRSRTVSNLPVGRLRAAYQEGFLLAFDVDSDPARPLEWQVSLFLRVTELSMNLDATERAIQFAGFVSDSYVMLDGLTIDKIPPNRTQYVEGTAFPLTNTGTVRPVDD